jgi:hypothetical protein
MRLLEPRPHGASRYRHGPGWDGTPGKGCRCTVCRRGRKAEEARRHQLIAAGEWEGYADASGTRRRIQALMRCGWPLAKLEARLGVSREIEEVVRPGGRVVVRPFTARAVAALYDELWDQPPPRAGRYDRAGSTRARNRAVAGGWPPPLGWDETPGPHCIDDPDATPAPGWERGERREWGVVTADAVELAGFGVDPELIAVRLGVKAATVERALERYRAVLGQALRKEAA